MQTAKIPEQRLSELGLGIDGDVGLDVGRVDQDRNGLGHAASFSVDYVHFDMYYAT